MGMVQPSPNSSRGPWNFSGSSTEWLGPKSFSSTPRVGAHKPTAPKGQDSPDATGFGLTAGLHRPANYLGRPFKLPTFRRRRPTTGLARPVDVR